MVETARSLPKGIRLVPGLLEHVLPRQVPPTVEARVKMSFLELRCKDVY